MPHLGRDPLFRRVCCGTVHSGKCRRKAGEENADDKRGSGSGTYARRSQAGVQPFIRKLGPSVRKAWVMVWTIVCDGEYQLSVRSFFVIFVILNVVRSYDGLKYDIKEEQENEKRKVEEKMEAREGRKEKLTEEAGNVPHSSHQRRRSVICSLTRPRVRIRWWLLCRPPERRGCARVGRRSWVVWDEG
jgi:hypothetical protein